MLFTWSSCPTWYMAAVAPLETRVWEVYHRYIMLAYMVVGRNGEGPLDETIDFGNIGLFTDTYQEIIFSGLLVDQQPCTATVHKSYMFSVSSQPVEARNTSLVSSCLLWFFLGLLKKPENIALKNKP